MSDITLKSKLKIVHVCSYYDGGAGRAAYRIHEALLKNGVDSFFLNIGAEGEKDSKNTFLETVRPYDATEPPNFVERQKNRIKFRIKKHFGIEIKSAKEKRKKIIEEFATVSSKLICEMASLPFAEYNILDNPLVRAADIIHLHWVAGMLDYPSFFKNNKKPVVWTLHDMNPFQGLFHYKEDEIRNSNGFQKFDGEIRAIKIKAIKRQKSKLAVVTPSGWLLNEASKSGVFKNSTSCIIPNPINNGAFSYTGQNTLKNDKNFVFLFIVHSIKVRRKGFDLLIDALKKVNISSFTVFVLGEVPGSDIGELDIRFLGTVKENEKLRHYFSMADAFIIPSREDNLPNVMLESFACGTAVIGFPVGGIKEHVIDYKTGLLAEEISSDSLARAIEKFCNNKEKFNRQTVQDYAKNHFNEELIASKYITLYKKLLKN